MANIDNVFKRGAASLLVGLSLMGLAGCATTGSYANNNIGYDECLDTYGDYKLVERNNDMYLEKLDGSESRQITHTPNTKESGDISKTKSYIIYEEDGYPVKRYLVKFDSDDSNRKEISEGEFYLIWNERRE